MWQWILTRLTVEIIKKYSNAVQKGSIQTKKKKKVLMGPSLKNYITICINKVF